MAEGDGDIISDVSGKNNHGRIDRAEWTNGKFDHGLKFDGDVAHVVIEDHPTLRLADQGTVTLWAFVERHEEFARIVAKDESIKDRGDALVLSLGGELGQLQVAFKNYKISGLETPIDSVEPDQWHHIAFVFTRSSIAAYVDGVPRELSNSGSINYGGDKNLKIGIRGDGQQAYNGKLDEVRIYNYPLTPEQILDVMDRPILGNNSARAWHLYE
jgi:hypothetical protein